MSATGLNFAAGKHSPRIYTKNKGGGPLRTEKQALVGQGVEAAEDMA